MAHPMHSLGYPLLAALALGATVRASSVDFHDHLGLQLWSLRARILTDLPAALDLCKGYGITEVEAAGSPGVPIDTYAKLLADRGLVAVGAHFDYGLLQSDFPKALHNAKVLGITYATVPWIPHDDKAGLTAAQAHQAAKDFDTWGRAFRAEGIIFSYHPHGYEFHPYPSEGGATGFDILVKEASPENLKFEMDLFWAYYAGQDPVELFHRLGNRWVLVHVKDLRKGAVRNPPDPSHAPATDNVAVGDGQIDWKAVLSAARDAGVAHYFIEDETPDPLANIPKSLVYLRALQLP